MPTRLRRFFVPDVDRHLLIDEGEYIIDEVDKHWVLTVPPAAALLVSMALYLTMWRLGPAWPTLMILGILLDLWAIIQFYIHHMDRFVITNMRVFRVHGIADQHLATMPMTRILDISVEQPLLGQMLGYGHFVFESAAQDQGLRVITYVAHPERRDLTIQAVIQRAGLRTNLAHPK
ncbi:PH domain-containing protein [Acidipropionibacterium timonense]|uniref:PH domain-containing protein n=1 Tax=Acidipropionibacterium timonense TaxID=2161818 RepID=UPI0010306EC4|nr:PH domain-containing protein [Acidipropionibacterium timonense]